MHPYQSPPNGVPVERNYTLYSGYIGIGRLTGDYLKPRCQLSVNTAEHDAAIAASWATGQPVRLRCAAHFAITPEITKEVSRMAWLDKAGWFFKTKEEKERIRKEDIYTRHRRVLKLPDPSMYMGDRSFKWLNKWPIKGLQMATLNAAGYISIEDDRYGNRIHSLADFGLVADHHAQVNLASEYSIANSEQVERALQPAINAFPSLEMAMRMGVPTFDLLVIAYDANQKLPTVGEHLHTAQAA